MARGVALQPLPCSGFLSQLRLLVPATTVAESHPRPLRTFFPNIRCYVTLSSIQFCYTFPGVKCCLGDQETALKNYDEAFARRMALAGLEPHHRIAIGVSGGPDSMALCASAASWKLKSSNGVSFDKNDGFIDGLSAIIVDHGLRTESKQEAHDVSRRVSAMGIRCEIVACRWVDGKPKLGHTQEAAREKRYQIFQKVCMQHQIGVLLIAHHADDQAELFVLRLSRNSGVLGLAGMAFTTLMFPCGNNSDYRSLSQIIVVRPLLEFTKNDMYKICQIRNLQWVDDPTNQNVQYARNRIRMALRHLPPSWLSELHLIIAACRKTRAYVENVSQNLLHKAVTVMDEGYAVVDLEILNPSEVENLCLSKFISSLMQFISQRNRNIRGHTLELLVDYIRIFPCKKSFTAAGCYLCPAPGSKGTKLLICCLVSCPLPPETELYHIYPNSKELPDAAGLHQIVSSKSYDVLDTPFLYATSETVLEEAKRLSMICESNYHKILQLQQEETATFRSQIGDEVENKPKRKLSSTNTTSSIPLKANHVCYLMNRFMVSWESSRNITDLQSHSCQVGKDLIVKVRTMMECDWLYLAALFKSLELNGTSAEAPCLCRRSDLEDLKQSTQKAITLVKAIPVAVRKSLPVLISSEGQLLSIPSINFNFCTCITASCRFLPKTPLGGDHASFL